jgi:16S rRNA processing protein RimM
MARDRKICVGLIAGAHGVRGLVRLRSFTDDPKAMVSYGLLTDESGARKFTVTLKDVVKDHFTASIDGVTDREAAEELRGTRLYAARAKMPKTKTREYYAGDLLGLAARDVNGAEYGTVLDVHDHGAGVFLEIGGTRKDSFMLPFTDPCVPEVDAENGIVTVAVPEGWRNEEKPVQSRKKKASL